MCHHEQENAFDQAKRLPALFSVLYAILHGYIKGITKDLTGLLKAHAVFTLIGEILGLIPLEPNLCHRMIVIAYL